MNKRYTDEFKLKVINEYLKNKTTMKKVGEKYGVSPSSIRNWIIYFENMMK